MTPSTGAQRSTPGSTTMTTRSAGVCNQYFAMLRRQLEIRRPEHGEALRIFRERRHTAPGSDDGAWSDLADARWAALVDAHFRSGEGVAANEIFDSFDSFRVLGPLPGLGGGLVHDGQGLTDLPDAGGAKDAQARGARLDMPSRMRT